MCFAWVIQILIVMLANEDFYESNSTTSDSDNDSALMEDAHSETISSSITTNGSSSLSDDENFIIINKTKSDRIEKFLRKKNKQKLIKYSKLSGLFNVTNRKQIWPLLINIPSYCPVEFDETNKRFFCPVDYYSAGLKIIFIKSKYWLELLDKNQIESHRYYGQVRMDVERTLKRFPPSKNKLNLQKNFSKFIYLLKIMLIQTELNYKKNLLLLLLKF